MDSLCKVVDRCLKLMKPNRIFSSEKWWETVIQDGEVPSRKTYNYHQWMQKKHRCKNQINKELERRKRPERLFFTGGESIYLVNENEVADMIVDKRMRKVVNTIELGPKEMRALLLCDKLSGDNKRVLRGCSDLLEVTVNGIITTLTKRGLLPGSTRKLLLKHLGIKPPAKKKKKKVVSMRNKPTRKWNIEAKKSFDKPTKLFPAGQILKTSTEAALYARVSKRTIRRWVQENDMPVTKEGYYIKSALDMTKNL